MTLSSHQQTILACLQQSAKPLSAYKILQQVRDSNIYAPQQVYRALEKLIGLHLIHRVESLNAYVACQLEDEEDDANPLIAVCQECQTSFEFSAHQALSTVQSTIAGIKFASQKITIEIMGLCWQCQNNQNIAPQLDKKNEKA